MDLETRPVPDEGAGNRTVNLLMVGRAVAFRWREGRAGSITPHVFTHPAELWPWVFSLMHERRPVWLWSHNLSIKLTAARFWECLEAGGVTLGPEDADDHPAGDRRQRPSRRRTLLVSNDPPTVVSVRDPCGASLVMVDVVNHFLLHLDELAELVGVRLGPRPSEIASDEDWEQWLERKVDVQVACVQRLLRMVREDDLGNLGMSVAGQALALWRHRGAGRSMVVNDELEHKRFARKSYHGARCLVRHFGACVRPRTRAVRGLQFTGDNMPCIEEAPVYRLDVNACYPSVMAGNWFPNLLRSRLINPQPAELLRLMRTHCACALVVLRSLDEPWPQRVEGGTAWRLGTFSSFLCGPELERALANGHVLAIEEAHLYDRWRPFDQVVSIALDVRRRTEDGSDPLRRHYYKHMINSLHGKIAPRGGGWELVGRKLDQVPWGVWHDHDPHTGRLLTFRSVGGSVQVMLPADEVARSVPLIAAYTTSYARELIRGYKAVAGDKGVLYEDADSLHVTQGGYDNLCDAGHVDDAEPGKLKVQHCWSWVIHRGPKNYTADGQHVRAGIKLYDTVDPLGLWHQTKWQRLDPTLNGIPPIGAISHDEPWSDRLPRIAGTVGEDGWVDYPSGVG